MKKIRLIELFAGIGAQAKALKNIGADFEHHRAIEFDKFAMRSYNAIHGTKIKTQDITETRGEDLGITDTDRYEYWMTYSFPCQDLSNAGKGKGMKKGSGTRSGLLWEVERLLNECAELPQILIMENVPQVHSKKNKAVFDEWIGFLRSKGYYSYWQDLNAKDYGIPQNRNRCFMVSLLDNGLYMFPGPQELKLRLKDLLEGEVEEKYYLSDKMLEKITFQQKKSNSGIIEEANLHKGGQKGGVISPEGVCSALTATDYKQPKQIITKQLIQVGNVHIGSNESNNRVYSPEGLCPTINTMQGGHRQPKIMVREATKKGYAEAMEGDSINIEQPNSKTRRGRVGHGVAQTITTSPQQAAVEPNYRIRKLTPKECWRLMGFSDVDFDKAAEVNSNTQLYKQAGNSIVVPVLEAIFRNIIKLGG